MKIGALLPRGGPAGLWGPSCEAAILVAAAELNAAGGIRDRPIRLAVADAGDTEADAAQAAATLIEVERVDAILGMHPSSTRAAVTRRAAGRCRIFTPQYEGGEHSPGVVATGATDADVLRPSVPWLIEHRRADRFAIVGGDYVWPRRGGRTAARVITGAGARVVAELVLPLGAEPVAVLDQLRRARPDVVVMFLLGFEAIRFNRAFAAAGLARDTLRLGLGIDETVLLGIERAAAENLYLAASYFAGIGGDGFLERYRDAFGVYAPPATMFGRSCYDAMHLIARMARRVRGRGDARLGRAMLPLVTAHRNARSDAVPVHIAYADGICLQTVASCGRPLSN